MNVTVTVCDFDLAMVTQTESKYEPHGISRFLGH